MSAHAVMPARRSAVPGKWVRACSNPECSWVAHHADPKQLAELARQHYEDPDVRSDT